MMRVNNKHPEQTLTFRTFLFLFAFFVIISGLGGISGCGLNEFKQQKGKLEPLVARRAHKDEVIKLLGTNYLYYKNGETNWHHLMHYFSREPQNRHVAVREYAAKWPTVMLYSTPYMMTWVFLDKDDRMANFVIGAQ